MNPSDQLVQRTVEGLRQPLEDAIAQLSGAVAEGQFVRAREAAAAIREILAVLNDLDRRKRVA